METDVVLTIAFKRRLIEEIDAALERSPFKSRTEFIRHVISESIGGGNGSRNEH